MSDHIKGYSTDQREYNFRYATIEPTKLHQQGVTSVAYQFMRSVGNDAVDSATTTVITAAAHSALAGDTINFTSGALSGLEFKVASVTTNTITLSETLSVAPAAADTFEILRYKTPTVTAAGVLQVDAALVEVATAADGAAAPALGKMVGGLDGGGNFQYMSVDTNGVVSEPATVADGGVLPALTKVISGYDGANVQVISTNTAGELIPAGSYLEDTAFVDGSRGMLILGTRQDAAGSPVTADGDMQTLLFDANGNLKTAATLAEQAIQIQDAVYVPGDLKIAGGVRQDAAGSPVSASGDAHPLVFNNNGELKVAATFTEGATAADGAAAPALGKMMGAYDGANLQYVACDANGVLSEVATAADGAAAPALGKMMGAYDGANLQYVSCDANGVLVEPATASDGAAGLPAVTKVISGYDGANVQAIHTDAAGDLQIDILTAPATYAEDTAHNSADMLSAVAAVRNDAGTALAGTTGDYIPLTTDANGFLWVKPGTQAGRTVVDTIRNDYSVTSVTTGAWVQLLAATSATANEIEIFDSSGQTLELGTGAAAAETRLLLIFPGGNGRVSVTIPAGTRLSARAISANASVGEIDINIYS